jgi:hypothetical protein
VCASERAGSKLTIFCAATGAGLSSLYFRDLSGACDSDMFIIAAREVVEGAGAGGPARGRRGLQLGCSSAAWQFHVVRR